MIDPEVAAKLKTDDLVPLLIKCMNAHNTKLDAVVEKLDLHVEQENATLARVLGAFPGDDLTGHRRYHEALIEATELRNRLVRECLIKASSAGILAGFGWLGWAIWQWFKIEVQK